MSGVSKVNKKSNLENLLNELFEIENKNISDSDSPDNSSNKNSEQPREESITPHDQKIIDSLKDEIEKTINASVEAEQDSSQISESSNIGGFDYENKVLKAIRLAGLTGNITTGAGASAAAADADIKINDEVFNIEVKLDNNAQMGGSSVRFGSKGIKLVKSMEPETEDLLVAAIASKASELNKLLSFISKKRPKAINSKVSGFPMSCTKDAWEEAAYKKLLVNVKIKNTVDFISKHYAKKGIFYIQIGGAGLFYLAGNPANLPIPQLQGNIDIEIRSARSGAKMLASGVEVVGGGIRVQARLKTKGQSPFTADDPGSLKRMLDVMLMRNANVSIQNKKTKL
jgi:hypothetical protein